MEAELLENMYADYISLTEYSFCRKYQLEYHEYVELEKLICKHIDGSTSQADLYRMVELIKVD